MFGKITLFLIFLAPICSLQAKDFRIERFTEIEGLPSSDINTLFQDERGYIWIGTEKGLSKYNGYEFKNYSVADGLNNNFIKAIYEDSNAMLWVGTNGGLNVIDLKKGKDETFKSFKEGIIVSSIIELEGKLFFSSNKGLHFIEGDSTHLIELPRIRTLHKWRDQLFIGAISGLYTYTSNEKFFKNELEYLENDSIVRAVHLENTIGYIGTDKGLYRSSRREGYAELILKNIQINDLTMDSDQRLWISSEKGLYRIKTGDSQDDQKLILNESTNHTLEDHEGNIWIATSEGLLKYTEYPFDYINPGYDKNSGISAILKRRDGSIWYGDANGRIWIKGEDSIYEQFERISTGTGEKPIQKLYEDSKGNIWISTLLNGIYIWDGKNLKSFNDPKGLLKFFTFDIHEQGNGKFWFGGARGLLSYQNGEFEYYTVENIGQAPFVTDIYEDAKGYIWLAMNSGLGIIKGENVYKIPGVETACSQIISDADGKYYLASDNRGLITFRYENSILEELKTITTEQGLSNNNAKSVLIDENSNLWIGTDFGLNKLSPDGKVRIFKMEAEISKSKCYQKSILELDNTIICGTHEGAIRIPKSSEVEEVSANPKTYITAINILNENYDREKVKSDAYEYNLAGNLVLPYNANFISFDFISLSYKSNDDIEYKFKLEGLEKDYSKPSTERSFTYANLAPGKYRFLLKAKKANSWDESPTSYAFIIRPPFWQEWWFITLVTVLFFGSVAAFVNYRIKSVRKEEEVKSELNRKIAEFRLVALRSQMNPHFIFNALYSIQHFITTNEKEEAINYLSKFASLIRLILENSGNNEISIADEMKMLDLYLDLEKLRFDNKFEYKIQADQAIHTEDSTIPYLLIQPFVENAVIHGIGNKKERGSISISFLPLNGNEDYIKCIVEDDGIGREAASGLKKNNPIKKKSMGLELNKERLSILNPGKMDETSVFVKDLKDEKGNAIGTRVEITIPLS